MNILLCGADGFLGHAITARLEAAGHRIIRGVHTVRQADDIALDYRRDLDAETWLPRLRDVDAVINAVGILRERTPGDFERIHHRAPAALFAAAAQVGIRRVIQISATGPGEQHPGEQQDSTGLTPYLSSKHAADAALLRSLPQGATVLRPTLIFGEDGASSQFFLALASLPLLAIPQDIGKVQPVHVDDLTAAVKKALEVDSSAPSRILEFPGPRALPYAEWLEGYRRLMAL
ncbi:MAG: NAD-dependent epimerase/dehydratase family protein, partial [Azoarcus sp.]|nr:NAD-dependent epimerase/dehydratase family protein [Azoarcus sp.]